MTIKAGNIELKGIHYQALPMAVVIQHHELWTYSYVLRFREGKVVTIEKSPEDHERTFISYQEKGLTHLWVKAEDAKKFLASVREKMKKSFSESIRSENRESSVLNLDDAYEVIAKMLTEAGLEEEALKMALEANRAVMEHFKADQNLVMLIRKMRLRCHEQFLKNLYASVLVQAMARSYSWYSSAIGERMVMAIMLADVGLSSRDYQLIKAGDWSALSQEALSHPLKNAKLVSRSNKFGHPEIAKIIEQHHEWPNGKGFPRGLSGGQIHFQAAFVITANAFVDLEFASNFESSAKYQNLQEIYGQLYEQGSSKNFKEAVSGLFLALGLHFPSIEDKSKS